MRTLISGLFFFIVFSLGSQTSFNKIYGFENVFSGTSFKDILFQDDTLILYGVALPDPSRLGAFFLKLDTTGTVLDYQYYPDSEDEGFITGSLHGDLISTSNNCNLFIGGEFQTNFGCLMKLNHEGEVDFYKKFDPAPDIQISLSEVIELSDGYLLGGYKHRASIDGHLDILLMKTDKSGNLLWEKIYGNTGNNENLCSLVAIDENHFVIGANRSNDLSNWPFTSTYSRGYMIHVDSLGNIIQEQETPNNKRAGICGLTPMSDGWLFGSGELTINSSYLELDLTIVRTGADINDVQWELEFPNPTGNIVDYIIDLEPTPDGNFLVLATYTVLPHGSTASTMKFTPEGQMLWFRSDTIFSHPIQETTDVYPSGMAVSPSGSIYVAAYANSQGYNPVRSYAWLLKITPDGCIDTLCAMTTGIEELAVKEHLRDIRVYPNPTSGKLQWHKANAFTDNWSIEQVEIWDSFGHRLLSKYGYDVEDRLDLLDFPSGLYQLLLRDKDGRVVVAKSVMKI